MPIDDISLREGTGRNADLTNAGYRDADTSIARAVQDKREESYGSDKAGTDAAARELIANRNDANETTESIASKRTIERKMHLDADVALSPELAADLLKEQREEDAHDVASLVEATDSQDFRDAVDKLRGHSTDAEKAAAAQRYQAEQRENAAIAEQVRAERVERETAQAEQAATQSLNAGRAAVLQLNSEFPALAQLPLADLEAALPQLHQHENPAIRRAAALAQTALDHGKAHHQHTTVKATNEYNNYAAAQDRAFHAKIAGDSAEVRAAALQQIPAVLTEMGYDPAVVHQLSVTNNEMGRAVRSAGFMTMVYNAAKQRVPANVLLKGKRAPASVPPVVRGGGRDGAGEYEAQTTARRDSGRTFTSNSHGLRDAAALLSHRRSR
jgi:hypothetical protein